MVHRLAIDAVLVMSLGWLSFDLLNEVGKPVRVPCQRAKAPGGSRLQKKMSNAQIDKLHNMARGAPIQGCQSVELFTSCSKPVHHWLLVSYLLIVGARLMGSVGEFFTNKDSGDFLLNLRHQSSSLRGWMRLTWVMALPLCAAWTVLGTSWLYEVKVHTPACLPDGLHTWFLMAWQLLSYMWILVHVGFCAVAWFLETCCRRVEGNLREVEDAEVRERWGEVSQVQGYNMLSRHKTTGLTPSAISKLTSYVVPDASLGFAISECAVCLESLHPGEQCRQLPNCQHAFHRACIDLWLLRDKCCPLCKHEVEPCSESTGGLKTSLFV